MRRHGVGALVVYEHNRPAGMLTDRDIAIGCISEATTMEPAGPAST